MVIVLEPNEADTPPGKLVGVPMPVAPVVLWVILVIAVLIQVVAEPGPVTVLFGVTVMVPVALTFPQPPVRGMV